jgi:TonB family protein
MIISAQLVVTKAYLRALHWSNICEHRQGRTPTEGERLRVKDSMLRRIWPAVLLCCLTAVAVAASTPVAPANSTTLAQRENQVSRTLTRASEFVAVPHISPLPDCEDVRPPEALTTPDPLFTTTGRGKRVKVSFIIGTDGHVHSPLILESAGIAGDRHVLQTVRTWRYRPATCNGVPTETEGKIEFSSR